MKKNTAVLNLFKNNTDAFKVIKEGTLVDAVLLEKGRRAAYFDLGAFGTGIVYGAELSNANEILKSLEVGGSISAKVIDIQNDNGFAELSLSAAGKQKVWQDLKELQEKGEILKVKIAGANSGGLLAEVSGIKSFLPASQLSTDHYPHIDDGDKAKILDELKKLVGQELSVKILDINSRTNKLVLSEREAQQENVKELLNAYKVGDLVDGIISGVADFGAFVRFADNPKIEGLIHISELEHKLIESPKEVVKVNDAVKAKIIDIKEGRVFLSLKALKADPWEKVKEKYAEGQEVAGSVFKFNPLGALINLDSEFRGFVHVAEFGGVEEMKKILLPGNTYKFKIESIKPEEKRIMLKLVK